MIDKPKPSKYPKSDQLRALREQQHEERVTANKRLIDKKVKRMTHPAVVAVRAKRRTT